ncbi:LamB/YcsF family protein [Paludisphaera sp.]|uniref:LamB/YcsF family protein n=1 Tax=Paludisphaera sp. TaxID=2017432 RepID=UPI00301DDFDC
MPIDLAPLGDRAFLARFDDEDDARRWADAVRARKPAGAVDVVLAYRSAAVIADPDLGDLDALEAALRAVSPGDAPADPGSLHEIPVLYDGPDLADAAARLGMSPGELVARHSAPEYRVFAIGFLPGFPYAGYLPDALRGLPRRESPRTTVPAGSVAIVGRQTAIYPTASPGGWHLLGRTPLQIASPRAGDFPIRAGDRVRFRPIDRDEGPMTVPHPIDVNADLGEGAPHDEALLDLVTSASISCGAHAGDPETIRRALGAARARGVVVGAHPGYPDREGFGRRDRDMTAAEVESMIRDQCADLRRLADEEGVAIRFLKPHGALYNQAQRRDETARGVIAAAVALGLPLLGQPGTPLESAARAAGVAFIAEGFPDRLYRLDGSLAPRDDPDAVLAAEDLPANVRALLAQRRVDTLCIHGDHPEALANARRLRAILDALAIPVRAFSPIATES